MIQKINYADKQTGGKFSASDANEIKSAVNSNADVLSKNSQSILSLQGGSLGPIKPTDAAPTPARNGNYTFSIGGNKPAWLTAEAGVTEVKAGDGVAVVYTEPSTYSYTHVDSYTEIEQTRSQSTSKVPSSKLVDDELNKKVIYNVTNEIPLATGQYYTQADAIAAIPLAVRKSGLELIFESSKNSFENYRFIANSISFFEDSGAWVNLDNIVTEEYNVGILTRNGQYINKDGTLFTGWFGNYAKSSTIMPLNDAVKRIFVTTDLIDHYNCFPVLFFYDENQTLISSFGTSGINYINESVPFGAKYWAVQSQDVAGFSEHLGFKVLLLANGNSIINKSIDLTKLSANSITADKMVESGSTAFVDNFHRYFPFTEQSYFDARNIIKSIKLINVDETHEYCFSLVYVNYSYSGYYITQLVIQDASNGFAEVMSGAVSFATAKSGIIRLKLSGIHYGNYSTGEVILDIPSNISFTNHTDKAYIHNSCIELPKYEIILPSKYPVVVGKSAYIYYESIIKNEFADKLWIESSCSNGGYPNKNYIKITPATSGSSSITFSVNSNGARRKSASTALVAVSASAGNGVNKKVLVIGDSKTDDTTKLVELQTLFNADVMDISLIGTKDMGAAPNEGYSGRNVIDFVTSDILNGAANPFWNPSTNEFDFTYYMTNNGFASCDILFIDHGANQLGSPFSAVKSAYDEIITSAKAYDANIRIVIAIQEGACLSEQTDSLARHDKYFINSVNTNIQMMLSEYDNRENENIIISAQYLNVDLYNDFPFVDEAISMRNPTIIKKCSDTIHPSEYGYCKIADIYFNIIKYISTL